ncbi:MAG: hypothetical protein MJA29_00980, partial [Candidatus Omnitrophica bacterium]|nr:hypothetical protein [Candidatus Omnitrophota bacterium]
VKRPESKPVPELTYLKLPPKPNVPQPPPALRQRRNLLPETEKTVRQTPLKPSVPKAAFKPHTLKEADRAILHNPLQGEKDVIEVRKKITIPEMGQPPINNPNYIKYYQIVREQIKRAAYRTYAGREHGALTISFLLSGDGRLQSIALDTAQSTPSEYLRSIGVRSIREAAPFAPFPEELSEYSRLSFNVTITFEGDY